jgi:lipopolysaccharide biosynthesis regulator YciM
MMILSSWIQFALFILGVLSAMILTIPSNVQMGSDYFDSYQYEKAFKYFSKVQKKDAMNLNNLKRLKDYYLVKGEISKAMVLQEKLVKLKPKNLHYWQDMENLYTWNLKPYEKLQAKEHEAELIPEKEAKSLYLEIAEGYRWLKKYQDANRIFEKLLKYNDPLILDIATSYYTSTKQLATATQLLAKMGETKPVYYRWLAELEESEGKYAEANVYYLKILGIFFGRRVSLNDLTTLPKIQLEDNISYFQRIRTNLQRMGNDTASEKLQEDLSAILPGNLLLTYDLGYYQIDRGEKEMATSTFKKILTIEKNPEKILSVCEVLSGLGKEIESNVCYLNLSKQHPRNLKYLEALAQSYEKLDQKMQALRIYEQMLKLQGDLETNAGTYRFLLVAQNSLINNGIINDANKEWAIEKSKPKQRGINPSKLEEIRKKVISLQNDVGERHKSESLLKKLIKANPKDISVQKQLAYLYFDTGRATEGREIFRKILEKNTDDQDGLFIKMEEAYGQSRFEEAYQLSKKLPVKNELFQVELRHEILFSSKHMEEYRDACLSDSHLFKEIELRCMYRLDNPQKAISELETYVSNKSKDQMNSTLVSWYLDQNNLKKAKKLLQKLEDEGQFSQENVQQTSDLKELKKYLEARTAWNLNVTSMQVLISKYGYNLTTLDLLKKLNGPGIGFFTEHVESSKPFSLFSPYAYYGGDLGEFKIGPTFSQGQKKLSSPFFIDGSYYGSKKFFGNLHFENSRPEYQLKELHDIDRAYRRILSSYLTYHEEDRFNVDLSLTHNDYTFNSQSGHDFQVFGEYLKQNIFVKELSLGARVFTTSLSSNGDDVNRLHIRRAFAQYAVVQYANSFLKRRFNQWNYLGKLALGGDTERKITFGQAYNARFQIEYLKDDQKGVRFYVDYYKESYLVLINELKIIGLNFFTYF